MEEKELLKERLQAITDKRRIQEYIAEKRRRVEEEKLNLQYIKKKALRDQWLMDGLSPQSEEEREAARLRAQDERQQSDALQSRIDRMEKEIEALEREELHISANEELVLKRLKEVERTAEDIIKGLGADARAATFATEVSGRREQRTGICQAGPAVAVSPESTREGAPGPSEDGGGRSAGEMTPERADELGRRAADEPPAGRPLCHRPVYSAAYFGPLAAKDARRRSPPPLRRSPARPPQERAPGNGRARSSSGPEEVTRSDRRGSLPRDAKGVNVPARGAFATVRVGSQARPTPLRALHSPMQSWGKRKAEGVAPTDAFRNPTGQPESVTLIFMGYENAPDEEDADCRAELVTVGCGDDDDDDDDQVGDAETETSGELLSYHPEGYKSKVFRPEAAKSRKAMSDDPKKAASEAEESDGQELNPGFHASENPDSDGAAMETAERDGGGEVFAAARSDMDREPTSPTAPPADSDDDDDDKWSGGRFRSDPALPGGAVCDDDGGGGAVWEEREDGHEGLRRNRSVSSSVSDTLSGAESVCETEARRQTERGGDPPRLLPPSGPEPDARREPFPDERDGAEDEGDLEEDEERRPEEDEAPSDISGESGPDPAPDDADVDVHIAAASSDSETDEKWRAVFSSSINKEDDDSYLDALHLSARELFVHKVRATDSEDRGDGGAPGAQGRPETPSLAPAVQEFGEDRRGRAPDRRLPKDFCVIQETASENVSTEHVDFRSAREQWRAMEERGDGKALMPAARPRPQPRAGRARAYAPVQNMERADGRGREAEPSAPQFSPCSEDSGLADSAPRSPDEEAERPPPPPAAPSLVVTPSPGGPGQRGPEDAIVRSASEFSLDAACRPQEKMFPSNPFFKLRSRSQVSLVDEEIRVLRRRERELREERARLYGRGKRMPSGDAAAALSLDRPASSPTKCKSSPSSPMKTPKMERSTLSCDHRFPEGCAAGRRKSAMALRWEAGHFAQND